MPKDIIFSEEKLQVDEEGSSSHSVPDPNRGPNVSTGFKPRNLVVHRFYNIVISSALIAIASPVLLALTLAVFATQGTGVFYRGRRLGKDRKPFDIYKFRTLDTERARMLTSKKVLPAGSQLETPLGKFLRASRLDELPQLFNVLLGDMNIVGPRPVREEIATIYDETIPNYDLRFSVKPGLCGQTQAYMSHGASKQTRARYNNVLCRAEVRYLQEIMLFTTVGWNVMRRTIIEGLRSLKPELVHRNALLVASSFDVEVHSLDEGTVHPVRAVNADYVRVPGLALQEERSVQWLSLMGDRGRRRRFRVELSQPGRLAGTGLYKMSPMTDYGAYILERYLLDAVLVPERRPSLQSPSLRALAAAMSAEPAKQAVRTAWS